MSKKDTSRRPKQENNTGNCKERQNNSFPRFHAPPPPKPKEDNTK